MDGVVLLSKQYSLNQSSNIFLVAFSMMYYCAFFAVHRLVQYNHLFVGCTVMVHKLFGRETVREHWLRRVANGLVHQHSRQVGGYCATLGPEHVVHACCVRVQHRATAQVWI